MTLLDVYQYLKKAKICNSVLDLSDLAELIVRKNSIVRGKHSKVLMYYQALFVVPNTNSHDNVNAECSALIGTIQ